MPTKLCSECHHVKKEPMQVAPGQMGMGYMCGNPENRDPIEGAPVPCAIARRELVMCGWEGKKWKAKEEDAEVKTLITVA